MRDEGAAVNVLSCARRCLTCARCRYMSVAKDDCSWFASCNMSMLSTKFNTGHQTLQVRRGSCGRAFFSRSCGEAEVGILDFAAATARLGAPPRIARPPAKPGDGLTKQLRSFCQLYAPLRGNASHFGLPPRPVAQTMPSATAESQHRVSARIVARSSVRHQSRQRDAPEGRQRGAAITRRSTLAVVLAETRSASLTWERFREYVLDPLSAELALCVDETDRARQGANAFYRAARYARPEPQRVHVARPPAGPLVAARVLMVAARVLVVAARALVVAARAL